MTGMTDRECDAYKQDYLAGIIAYAWWSNGSRYVGCGRYTLAEALEYAEKHMEYPDEL